MVAASCLFACFFSRVTLVRVLSWLLHIPNHLRDIGGASAENNTTPTEQKNTQDPRADQNGKKTIKLGFWHVLAYHPLQKC